MVEDDRFPVGRFMARLAFGSEIFLMLVILLVATDAGHGKSLASGFQFRCVAGIAFDFFVLAL